MGRHNLSPQRVHATATGLLSSQRLTTPPPWYNIIGQTPPSARLDRPALQRPQNPRRKPSRLFSPLPLTYEEDRLRWDYFNDHPWELARPRVVLEDDGKDGVKWDWSVPLDHSLSRPVSGARNEDGRVELDREWDATERRVAGRPVNGEACVYYPIHPYP